jgi:hypothetical protein
MPESNERGSETRVRMLSFTAPAPPWIRPGRPGAEEQWTDRSWTSVEVVAWAHSDEGFAHILSAAKFSWLVALKFPGGLASSWDGWYGYEVPYLRPAGG